MRTIPLSRAILVFWEDAVFLEAALLADDETRPLATPVTEALNDFPALLQRDLDTRRAVIRASAHASVADAGIDGGLRRLFNGTLFLVGQNRKSKEFTTLFSTHIGNIVKHALRRQIEVADEIVGKLALSIYPDAFRTDHEGFLQPLLAKGKAVILEQRAAELSRAEGRIETHAWKQEVNAVRLSVYAALLGVASKTGRKKSWAEAFFYSESTSSAQAEDEPVDEGAEATGEAGEAGKGGDGDEG